MWLCWRLFLLGLGMLARQRRDLILEDMILRQQLAVWERSGRRPRLQQRDRGVSKPYPRPVACESTDHGWNFRPVQQVTQV